MSIRLNIRLLLAAFLVAATCPVISQVAPAANGGGEPLVVGAGFSDYYTDWSGRLAGPTAWVDWNFVQGPSILHGFGIQAEARDLNYIRTGGVPNLRLDYGGGGVIYTSHRYNNFHPYVKFMVGYGSIDFTLADDPYYKHDSRPVLVPGGGLEYRMWRNVWLRADYEYQFWTGFFNGHALNPQGPTVGVSYHFRQFHRQ